MDLFEIIGYIASVLVAISIGVNSVIKFRWINLAGAATFSLYGFLIHAYPVGILNGIIAVLDAYYIVKIYRKKEVFDIFKVPANSSYLKSYLKFNEKDIQKFFPNFQYQEKRYTYTSYILRDMNIVGVFLAYEDGDALIVELDYVGVQYRDYKNGRHIYHNLKNEVTQEGYKIIKAKGNNEQHKKYLLKMGFKENPKTNYFEKTL